jgi:hypothetical protein
MGKSVTIFHLHIYPSAHLHIDHYLCALKFIVAAILLLAFTAQTFSKGLLILDYYADTASFEKNCVNKNHPGMHCCGRCQLKKKMQQQENGDKQNSEQRDRKDELPLSAMSYFATLPPRNEFVFKQQYAQLNCGKAIHMPYAIFHPPGMSA